MGGEEEGVNIEFIKVWELTQGKQKVLAIKRKGDELEKEVPLSNKAPFMKDLLVATSCVIGG